MTHPDIGPHGWRLGTWWIVAIWRVSIPCTGLLVVKWIGLYCWWWGDIQRGRAHSDQAIPLRLVSLWRGWWARVGPMATPVMVWRMWVREGWTSVRGLVWALWRAVARVGVLVRRPWLTGWRRITHVIPRNILWLLVGIPWEKEHPTFIITTFLNYLYTQNKKMATLLQSQAERHNFLGPYLWSIVGVHTEKQMVVGERHSTSQRAVAGGTLVNLWVPPACALPRRGGPLASLGGPWHEVAVAYRVWASGPCYRDKCQQSWVMAILQTVFPINPLFKYDSVEPTMTFALSSVDTTLSKLFTL